MSDNDLCKCGHLREDHRDGVFACGCADLINGIDVECDCDDFEEAELATLSPPKPDAHLGATED